MNKFMTPEDAFKKIWHDPKRVRLAVETEDVSVMQVAEQFFIKGFGHCQLMAIQMANLLYDTAINGHMNMPPTFTPDEAAASTTIALRQLIVSLGKGPKESPPEEKGTVH
jgi:hypothetical protein